MADPQRRTAAAEMEAGSPPGSKPRHDARHDESSGRIAAMPASAGRKAGVLQPVAEGLDESAVLEIARQALRAERIALVRQPIVLWPQPKRPPTEGFRRLRPAAGYQIQH